MTKPTIEEQIADYEAALKLVDSARYPLAEAVLTSLRKLQAIENQPVPVEPAIVQKYREIKDDLSLQQLVMLNHIDALLSKLQVVQHESDEADKMVGYVLEDKAGQTARAESAEARNARMVEFLKDPTQAMVDAGMAVIDNCDAHQTFTNMSAELLREVDK